MGAQSADTTRALSIGAPSPEAASLTIPTPALPWQQQQGESGKAYEAFSTYRDLGPGRSITTLERTLHKSRALLGGWSSRYNWVNRCRAFDLHNQQQEETIAREERAQKLRTTLSQHDQTASNLLTIARRMLLPPADLRERARQPDPSIAQPAQKEIDAWVPAPDVVRAATFALDKAVHHQRLAAGLPTNVTQQDVMLRTQVQEAADISESVIRLLEEFTCDDCKAAILPHLRRLRQRVAGVKEALPEGLL